MEPVALPATRDETLAVLDRLTEIHAHRDWVIEGLRAHVANIEHDLARALERVAELEKHTANVEHELVGAREHTRNLEAQLGERELRLAEVEALAERLEQRIRGRRVVRLAKHEILPEHGHGELAALFRIGNRIWRERPDLQQRFPQDRAADYWYWLLWDRDESPELARVRLPVPPPHLRERVVGRADAVEYRRSGLVDWWRIDGCLRRAGFDPALGGTLLDFGAGCGRIVQCFALYAERTRIFGCDVDPEAVAWCASQLGFARFEAIPPRPPTPFGDGSFDAVYAFSVFSHLPEKLHLRWLEELHRIARPGAAVVLTVHGRHVTDEVLAGRALPDARERLARQRQSLERSGFAFVPYEKLGWQDARNERFFASWDLSTYGDSFVFEAYVRQHWTRWFEVVEWVAAPDAWQDYVVLRRR
jgi:SAM-dependent methyltransferase